MRKINIAVIGANRLSHAQQIIDSIKKQNDLFNLVGYCLPENEHTKFPEVAAKLNGYPEMTLEEILNNPEIEAVAVETEEIYLTKYARMAAEHGKHIHMEKPGGTSLAEFEAMIAAVKAGGKVFHTGYMYRYNPHVMALMERIRAGELGEIISVEAQMNCYHNAQNRQWLENFPGGMMFFLGCHLVDLILQIKGMPDDIIPYNRCSGVEGVTSTDFGMALFTYPNGISFAKTSAVDIGGFARRQLVVSGTKGTVELQPLEMITHGGQFTTMTEYRNPGSWVDRGTSTDSPVHDRYDSMMASFAAMVRGEKENPWNADYELNLYRCVLRACGCPEGK